MSAMKYIKPLERGTDKVESQVKSVKKQIKKKVSTFKVKLICVLTCALLGFILIFSAVNVVATWGQTHKFRYQFPVVIRTPIWIEKITPTVIEKKVEVTPTPTPKPQSEKEIIMAQKHGEILTKIYQLETQSGKTDYCRLNGKGWGGFGVMYQGKIVCYETFTKAVERAEFWLVNLKVDEDLASALCLWNLGIYEPSCLYYQKFMTL